MARKKKGSEPKIVYTYGVFDLFHRGHAELLKEAKALGDVLVVGVFTDGVAESFKRKPVIGHKDRMAVVASLRYVDRVVPLNQLAPDESLKRLKPHVLAKGPGAGWGEKNEIPGAATMKKLGGKVVKLKYHNGISTSDIIKKIKTI